MNTNTNTTTTQGEAHLILRAHANCLSGVWPGATCRHSLGLHCEELVREALAAIDGAPPVRDEVSE